MQIFGIVAVIIIFLLLVVIHERGHFFAAKKSGVHVKEFGIGIPPKVARRRTDKQGTKYTINAIPLGGFVRLKGDDPFHADFFKKDSFNQASYWKKIMILMGGIIMNILTARVCFFIIFIANTQPITILPDDTNTTTSRSHLFPSQSYAQEQNIIRQNEDTSIVVLEVISGSLAQQAGITAGSTITSINGQQLSNDSLSTVLAEQSEEAFTLEWQEQENKIKQSAEVQCNKQPCQLGVFLKGPFEVIHQKYSAAKAATLATKEIREQTKLTFSMLGTLANNLFSQDKQKVQETINQISGPVGATKVGADLWIIGGWTYLVMFAAMISLALALFNILPIPALDGGRIVTTTLQHLFCIPGDVFAKKEGYINMFFFAILMIIGVLIMVKDYQQFRI